MSGPVDVLAVMDKACELHANGAYADAWEVGLDGIAEVRAAVAELIEAAHEYFTGYCVDEADDDCATGSGFYTGCTREQHEAAKRLREALARVQGGAA